MKKKYYMILLLFLAFSQVAVGQQGNRMFLRQLEQDPHTPVAFSVANSEGTLERLLADKAIRVKSVTPNWIFIQASAQWIADAQKTGEIQQFYFEHSMPVALNDTSLVTHHVTEVHNGAGGLQTPFTGKDVIIGYVDQGLDYNHPDFIDGNGDTRVLYYWDHTAPFDAVKTPLPYGYGQLWFASEINAGSCTSNEEASAHGTSVAGAGSSNAGANGQQKGVAPDSKIIVVETNFDLPNWTLTVADACDFIFKKADSLGLPAVVNLSVGSYLGSHDGDDPAAELMEQLLDEQPGRIIVGAAGNSGAWGKYHVHGDVDLDTSFVWFQNNPAGSIAPNSIYFDLWSDLADATWTYALAANLNSGSFAERAETQYRLATTGAGAPIFDTLYNGSNRIATIELYPEIVGNNFHIEVFFSAIDSTAYNYAFKTTGSGNYDAWSGTAMGLNDMITTLPSAGVYPAIVHYNMPDAEQTVVSSWNCSEKVISVGNIRNRFGHTDKNGNYYQPAASYTAVVGELSPNSSKGPSRHGLTKPDISACGDVSLSAGPMWVFNYPPANSVIDIDNWHVRNGGTSMASPIVAGIAALYLEKCSNGTYATFKNDLLLTAFTDGFTGTVPNNAYGYGKAHALNTLLASNYTADVNGPTQYCGSDSAFAVTGVPVDSAVWNTGDITTYTPITGTGSYFYQAYDASGCIAYSDTLVVSTMGDIPPMPVITAVGTTLSTDPYPNLQWYENGTAMSGETGTSITIVLPNANNYTVVATGTTGCEAVSAPYNASAGIVGGTLSNLVVYPNPAHEQVTILSDQPIREVIVYDLRGNKIRVVSDFNEVLDVKTLASGTYLVQLKTENATGWMKIVRN